MTAVFSMHVISYSFESMKIKTNILDVNIRGDNRVVFVLTYSGSCVGGLV